MSKQLRLFTAKPSKPREPYFKNAQTAYHTKLADYMAKDIVPSTKIKAMNFFRVPVKKPVFQGMSLIICYTTY